MNLAELRANLTCATVVLIFGFLVWTHAPAAPSPVDPPNPAPATALATTAKTYRDGMSAEFKAAGAAVKGGAIKGPPDLFVFLQTRAAALQGGLKDAATSHATTDGKGWTDANAMAADLQAISDTLGAAK